MLIPRVVLSELARHTDPCSSRYALGAIHVVSDGKHAMAEAADGHRLMRVAWEEPAEADYPHSQFVAKQPLDALLPAQVVKRLARQLPVRKSKRTKANPALRGVAVQANGAAAKAFVLATDGTHEATYTVRQVEGRFPKTADVIPKPSQTRKAVYVNARLLGEVLLSLAAMADTSERVSVELTTDGPEAPIVVTRIHEGVTTRAVVMPLTTP
jgi:hypothetical protein